MVDEESHETVSEPGEAPPSDGDERPNGEMIEGDAAGEEAEAVAPKSEAEKAARTPPPAGAPPERPFSMPRSEPKPPGSGGALLAGAFAGAAVSVLAAVGGFALLQPTAGLSEADASRLAALESATNRNDAAIAGLDKRVGAVEGAHVASGLAAVDKRVAALEARPAASGGAPSDVNAPADKSDSAQTATAPKTETRVAPEKPSSSDNPAATAIVAESLSDKLASGAPYPSEVSALTTLGVDPAQLAPLKTLVDGAPTNHALVADFEAAEPRVLAAVAPAEAGGVVDKFLARLRGLVQVRRVGETAGDDPQALASQIVANLQRGDLDGALAAFANLPAPARQAAESWAAETQHKQAAVAAARAVREAAVARLVESAKP